MAIPLAGLAQVRAIRLWPLTPLKRPRGVPVRTWQTDLMAVLVGQLAAEPGGDILAPVVEVLLPLANISRDGDLAAGSPLTDTATR